MARRANAGMADRAGCQARKCRDRAHHIGVGLIGRVQHSKSPAVSQPPGSADPLPRSAKKTSAFVVALRDNFAGRSPDRPRGKGMAKATLAIASKNYGSWSLRGRLRCKMAGVQIYEGQDPVDRPPTRPGLVLLFPPLLELRRPHERCSH